MISTKISLLDALRCGVIDSVHIDESKKHIDCYSQGCYYGSYDFKYFRKIIHETSVQLDDLTRNYFD